MRVFHALWDLDFRNFDSLNGAVMVLLPKTDSPAGLRDYRPISLVHSIGKLFSKCLALRLAPHMKELVKHNQSAFIRDGRSTKISRRCSSHVGGCMLAGNRHFP